MFNASRRSQTRPPRRGQTLLTRRRDRLALAVLALSFFLGSAALPAAAEQQFADIVAVKVKPRGAGKFDFDVTVSSPYDTAQRYADAFRVMGKDGKGSMASASCCTTTPPSSLSRATCMESAFRLRSGPLWSSRATRNMATVARRLRCP